MNKQSESFKFDVFGKLMMVDKINGQWQLFAITRPGMKQPIHDVVIPEELTSDELAGFLADIYHESANEKHPKVNRLD